MKIFDSDQLDRTTHLIDLDSKKLMENDKERITQAHLIYEEYKTSKSELSAEDLYYLAMIFQHSSIIEDFLIASELATLSGEKGNDKGKWLSAAAEDRYLLAKGEKQKWGTQFKKDFGGEWELQPMASDEESGVSDEMRREKGVPERAKQLEVFLRLRNG
jgi:hypothetical protein